ncbi:hypothetical protein D3C80_1881700 [compost metagenome]
MASLPGMIVGNLSSGAVAPINERIGMTWAAVTGSRLPMYALVANSTRLAEILPFGVAMIVLPFD